MADNIDFWDSEKQRERAKKPRARGLFKLKKERKCNQRCPMFGMCRFQFLSFQIEGKCALVNSDKIPREGRPLNISDPQKHRIIKFLFGSREDLLRLMRAITSNMDMAIDKKNPRDLERLLKAIGYIYDKEFGEKTEQSGDIGETVINIVKPTATKVLMELIRGNHWECISSTFSIMEISDMVKDKIFVSKKLQNHWTINRILRERYKKDLNHNDFEDVQNYLVNGIFNTYSFITFLTSSEEGWRAALDFSIYSNISAPDAIQLATAWNGACNIFITSDNHFIESAKNLIEIFDKLKHIQIYTPTEFLKIIRKGRSKLNN